MINWLKGNKLYAVGSIIIIFALVYFVFLPKAEPSAVFETEEDWLGSEEQPGGVNAEEEEGEENDVIVDVKGAVKKPGVYEAEADERVIDMILKAGGLTDTADEAKINFAIRVVDEMVIYVPGVGEEPEGQGEVISAITGGTEQNDGKVNINTATEAELQTLTGIGPSKATAIIEFREKNGPFKVIEDLKLIGGIGDKSFEKLQESIKVK